MSHKFNRSDHNKFMNLRRVTPAFKPATVTLFATQYIEQIDAVNSDLPTGEMHLDRKTLPTDLVLFEYDLVEETERENLNFAMPKNFSDFLLVSKSESHD